MKMKVLKIKYYKRPTLETGSVSCNISKFTAKELEDAKRIIEIGIDSKQRQKQTMAKLSAELENIYELIT